MNYYLITMNSFQKHPYIGMVHAKSITAAKRIFIQYLLDNNYFRTKKSLSAYTADPILKKYVMANGIPAINFERSKE